MGFRIEGPDRINVGFQNDSSFLAKYTIRAIWHKDQKGTAISKPHHISTFSLSCSIFLSILFSTVGAKPPNPVVKNSPSGLLVARLQRSGHIFDLQVMNLKFGGCKVRHHVGA